MTQPLNLQDRVVIVTGAGRGIGREIALLCAREGASVVVNDLGVSTTGDATAENPAADVVAEITALGGRAVANNASIADPTGAEGMIEDALSNFGRIDTVINNAGILRDAIFHKLSIADWQSVIEINLNGTFYVSKAAAKYFREQGSGSYVHFTSTSGLVGNVGQSNYSAAKLGVAALSRSIAIDMERFGVRSNCIAPFAWSRMTASIPADTPAQQARVERIKQMTPAKIAPLTVFLCSDAAAGVNGQIFSVRKNEIFLFSQPRPIRSVHQSEGWTVASIAEVAMPALRGAFTPLDKTTDVFSWDPI